MKNRQSVLVFLFFIFIFVALVYRNIQLTAIPLYDWDESIYARVAYETVTNNTLTMTYNNQLWVEKPPLVIYLLSLIMMVFGQSVFWLRSLSLLMGIATLYCLYKLSQKIARALFKEDTALVPFVSLLPICLSLSTILFIDRTTLVDYDMPLTLAWLLFFFADTFPWKLAALLLGVLSRSLLGYFPLAFEILYFKKIKRPLWQWLCLLLIPLVWHFIALVLYKETFIQQHIVDHLLRRVTSPIELHFGGRLFYIKELWNQFSYALIIIALGYGVLAYDTCRQLWKTRRLPKKEILILFSPLVYITFLTISKTKIYWYITPILPLFSLIIVYLFYRFKNRFVRIGLSSAIFLFFLYQFLPQTIFFKPIFTPSDMYKIAVCIKKHPIDSVGFLVSENERRAKNVIEAANIGISSSFIYGGTPSFVYESQKRVDFYYDVSEFQKKSSHYKVLVFNKNDIKDLSNLQSAPTLCESGDWKSIIW